MLYALIENKSAIALLDYHLKPYKFGTFQIFYMNKKLGLIHRTIIDSVKWILKKAYNSNKTGKNRCPILINENDICCLMFKNLYNPPKYLVRSEYSNSILKQRSDLVIFDSKRTSYKLNKNRNPYLFKSDKYLATLEFKLIWFQSKNRLLKKIIPENLKALLKFKKKNWSELIYLIIFDYKGLLNKDDVQKLKKSKYRSICIIYADIKNNKLLVK